ncbi:MAG: hypothetical protein A2075_16560 [Geobacteraceae bacterium GWC2_58_44]|nr:MAG: hypothetical protein A2075_16560 [Geobacteraceae bacterium GWC2_58_44]
MEPAKSTSSLRSRLVIPAAAIMLVLSFGLVSVGYWAGNAIVNTMSEQLIRHMTTSIREHVKTMMDVPPRMLTRVQNAVARHHIALTDPHALAPELYALLRDEPGVDWLYFANEAGGIVSNGRLEDGTRVILMTDRFQAGVIREYNASPDGQRTTLLKSGGYFDPFCLNPGTAHVSARKNYHKFLPAVPEWSVAFAYVSVQHAPERGKYRAGIPMAVDAVHRLEVAQVDHHYRQGILPALKTQDFVIENRKQVTAVVKPGQFVDDRKFVYLPIGIQIFQESDQFLVQVLYLFLLLPRGLLFFTQ